MLLFHSLYQIERCQVNALNMSEKTMRMLKSSIYHITLCQVVSFIDSKRCVFSNSFSLSIYGYTFCFILYIRHSNIFLLIEKVLYVRMIHNKINVSLKRKKECIPLLIKTNSIDNHACGQLIFS